MTPPLLDEYCESLNMTFEAVKLLFITLRLTKVKFFRVKELEPEKCLEEYRKIVSDGLSPIIVTLFIEEYPER